MESNKDVRQPQSRRRRRSRRGEAGQSLVELGLMLPLILILVIGVIEVNNALNAYITVVNSARDGARLGSKGGASTVDIQTLVRKDLERLPQPTVNGDVTVVNTVVDGVDAVAVTSCYDHKTILRVNLLMPETFRICSKTTMPRLN
jgi:Flp pilus assembly protein TadG